MLAKEEIPIHYGEELKKNLEIARRLVKRSVIIAFARICRLDLLERLFKKVIVSEAVWREITVEEKPDREKILREAFIQIEKAGDRRLVAFLEEFVDKSEAEAIVIALELNPDLLLIDECGARSLAKKLELQVMGTLGLLVLAKYRGLVQKVKSTMTSS